MLLDRIVGNRNLVRIPVRCSLFFIYYSAIFRVTVYCNSLKSLYILMPFILGGSKKFKMYKNPWKFCVDRVGG